jgi:hypothetical protein
VIIYSTAPIIIAKNHAFNHGRAVEQEFEWKRKSKASAEADSAGRLKCLQLLRTTVFMVALFFSLLPNAAIAPERI